MNGEQRGKISFSKLIHIPSRPKTHIDMIKIVAIFMVLYNHTGFNGYALYRLELEQPWHWLILAHSLFIRIAVPLFFMCSGALLLGKEESYKKVFFHRFLRFAIMLAVASFIVYAMNNRGVNSLASFISILNWNTARDFFIHLYTNGISYAFWYLYSYLGYMLMLPLIRKIAPNMKRNDFVWIIVTFMIAQIIPIIDYMLFHGEVSHTTEISFFVKTKYVIFPLTGYYLENKMEKRQFTSEAFVGLICLSVLSIGVSLVLVDWSYEATGSWTSYIAECCLNVFTIIPAITVYYGLKLLSPSSDAHPRFAKVMSVIADCTFGVYLFELLLRQHTLFIFQFLQPYVGTFWAGWLQILCACAIGVVLTFIWKIAVGLLKMPVQRLLAKGKSRSLQF